MRLDSSASESVESLVRLTKYHPVFPVSSDYSLSVRGAPRHCDFECHSGDKDTWELKNARRG